MFSPLKESEGVVAFFTDRTKEEGAHYTLWRQQRMLNGNQALCEWNEKGDRAVVTVSSDIDRVGGAGWREA